MTRIWKQELVDNCPRCGLAKEKCTRIIKFKSAAAVLKWTILLTKLGEWLDANRTYPDIFRLIMQVLYQLRSGTGMTILRYFEFDGIEGMFTSQ